MPRKVGQLQMDRSMPKVALTTNPRLSFDWLFAKTGALSIGVPPGPGAPLYQPAGMSNTPGETGSSKSPSNTSDLGSSTGFTSLSSSAVPVPPPTAIGSSPGGAPAPAQRPRNKPATSQPGAVKLPLVSNRRTAASPPRSTSASAPSSIKAPTKPATKVSNFVQIPTAVSLSPAPQTEAKEYTGPAIGHLTLAEDWDDTKRHLNSLASPAVDSIGGHIKSYLEGLGQHTVNHLNAANVKTLSPLDPIAARPTPITQGF